MQGDIHEDLIERAVEEGGIHRDHRMQATHGKASRRRDSVLFGDADVEAAIGKRLCKPVQPGRIHHRCRNGDDSFILTAQLEELVGEQLGPGLPGVHRRSPRRSWR